MSRFVAAGSDGQETNDRDEAWLKAQQQIEATKQKKTVAAQQEGGTSLYDTLQANKAKKQEEFEEATRLRNQFRSLDEDEVGFLDSVLEQSRNKEIEVKRETRDQLEAFRKQQEEAEKAARQDEASETPAAAETWSVASRKRKKGKEKEGIGGLKVRRLSTAENKDERASEVAAAASPNGDGERAPPKPAKGAVSDAVSFETPLQTSHAPSPAVPSLGLGAYSSDED